MIGYGPQGAIFDEANEISEYVWRKLADKYSHSMMRDQMQRGAWPPDLVRYVVASNASRARRAALHDWRAGFSLVTLALARRPAPLTYTYPAPARERLLWVREALRGRPAYRPRPYLFKVYLGTFRGQRFAVSELVE